LLFSRHASPLTCQVELCKMVVECCSQERSYSTFYGLIGERFCKLNRVWTENFQEAFATYYDTIHRYETNKLRNIGRFFGHLLASDAISWAVLHVVHMNEEETTSSSRIFVKIMMGEIMEDMGTKRMIERFRIPDLRPAFAGMFPMDNPKNTRFAINYFTSINLGPLTDEMREYLKNAPKLLAAQQAAQRADESSDTDSSDLSSTESSDISSDSDDDSDSEYSRKRGPPRRRRYSSDDSRGRAAPPAAASRRQYNDDGERASPPPRRASPPHQSRRDSPPPRRRRNSDERDNVSPPPRRRSPSPSSRRRSPSPPSRRRPSPPRRSRDDGPSPRRY
jgi:pre-mRNA-splicing factor CWC22